MEAATDQPSLTRNISAHQHSYLIRAADMALPTEVLDQIFESLSPSDLKKIRLVCQAYNKAAEKSLFRHIIIQRSLDQACNVAESPRLSGHVKSIEILNFEWAFNELSSSRLDAFVHFSSKCSTLSLSFDGKTIRFRTKGTKVVPYISAVARLLHTTSHLQALSVSSLQSSCTGSPWSTMSFIFPRHFAWSNLTSLNLRTIKFPGPELRRFLLAQAGTLRRLVLKDIYLSSYLFDEGGNFDIYDGSIISLVKLLGRELHLEEVELLGTLQNDKYESWKAGRPVYFNENLAEPAEGWLKCRIEKWVVEGGDFPLGPMPEERGHGVGDWGALWCEDGFPNDGSWSYIW